MYLFSLDILIAKTHLEGSEAMVIFKGWEGNVEDYLFGHVHSQKIN